MNRRLALSVAAGLAALALAPLPGRADSSPLTPGRLNTLDQLGYFTPGFKSAVRDLVNSKHALEQANAERIKLTRDLPDLQEREAEAEANVAALRQELARYDHPEENDFTALQKRMNDPAATLEEQITLAQAYVWAYPASPHESEAQQILQQTQMKLADQRQAEKDAEAARQAAHAKLVQRAQARDLSLGEWRDFLRGMSQDDLIKLFGRPSLISEAGDYWTYSGDWIVDSTTNRKFGMQINFNAGRVVNVDEKPPSP